MRFLLQGKQRVPGYFAFSLNDVLQATFGSNLGSKAAPRFVVLTLMKQSVHNVKVGHQVAKK